MHIFFTILILLLMLGILVSSHEAGHLVMAKCFNVYCLEYSIGFGPKLFSKKRKGGETAFSIRAIPLGGYVSMFGEGVELPDGVSIPTSRSLEGISKWKRGLILIAGISVNLMLSLIFVFVYTLCFQSYYSAASFDTGLLDESSLSIRANSLWGESDEALGFDGETNRLYSPFAFQTSSNGYYIVDPSSEINGEPYVACFSYPGIGSFDFLDNLTFFKPVTSFFPSESRLALGLTSYPDISQPVYALTNQGVTLTLHLTTMSVESRATILPDPAAFTNRQTSAHTFVSASSSNEVRWGDPSSSRFQISSYQFYPSFERRLQLGCENFAYLVQSTGLGLKELFTLNFSNLGSIVAMGGMLSSASTSIGWGRTFFFFGSYLSLNLAIFNLLPFPGLDGWSLLVTVIEGAVNSAKKKKWERQHKKTAVLAVEAASTDSTIPDATQTDAYQPWKIPEKTKNIVSGIGLILLFLLAILLTVQDISRFF